MVMPAGIANTSHCYVIRDGTGQPHLIDSGWSCSENQTILRDALTSLGHSIANLKSVTLTHMHWDHGGLAPWLNEEFGIPVLMSDIEAGLLKDGWRKANMPEVLDSWRVPGARRHEILEELTYNPFPAGLKATEILRDGDFLPVPGTRIQAMLTPGHTRGHMCFISYDRNIVFTGDHVLPRIFPGLGLDGEHLEGLLALYLESLERLSVFGSFQGQTGHVGAIKSLGKRLEETLTHHRNRQTETQGVLATNPGASVWDLATRLTWSSGWENLTRHKLFSALLVTAAHYHYAKEQEALSFEPRAETS